MSRLLMSNFSRLKKGKLMWIYLYTMLFIGLFTILNANSDVEIENLIFVVTIINGFLSAVFTSLFIGTEYSDGTLRNKLIIGHKRTTIYLANLITVLIVTTITAIAYLVPVIAIGLPKQGGITMTAEGFLILVGLSIVTMILFDALYTFLSMLISGKAMASVTCLLTAIVLLFINALMFSALTEPKEYILHDAEDITGEEVFPNPAYITGVKREVYQFITDVSPMGQALQIELRKVEKPARVGAFGVALTTILTVSGVVAFKKKDIK